jgi:hypothetical protein
MITKFSKLPVFLHGNLLVDIFSRIADDLMWEVKGVILNGVSKSIEDRIIEDKKIIKDKMLGLGILHGKTQIS